MHHAHGGHWLLENHGDVLASDLAQLFAFIMQERPHPLHRKCRCVPCSRISPSRDPAWFLHQLQNGKGRHALAAAALPHHTEGSAAGYRDVYPIHSLERSLRPTGNGS